jgi:hypothetical protein
MPHEADNQRGAFGLRPYPGNRAAVTALQLRDALFTEWCAARAEANLAYDAWCFQPGEEAYVVYRAAEDRADAAEEALARVSVDFALAA